MITMQITVEVKYDRQGVLTLPPEVPTGQTELVVTVSPQSRPRRKPAELRAPRWPAGPLGQLSSGRIGECNHDFHSGATDDPVRWK